MPRHLALASACSSLLCFSILGASSPPALGDDWPQYRGPRGDGIAEVTLSKSWPDGGPIPLWKAPTPTGFSSFAVAGGHAYTLVRQTIEGVDHEVCLALDAKTGKTVWSAPVGIAQYDGGGDSGSSGNKGGDGPRSTPAVDHDHVYTLNNKLVLTCLETASGKEVWKHDLIREYAGRNIAWQNAASPVIDGDLIFVAGGGPGQSLIAFRKTDGTVAWTTGDEKMTHATPTVATLLDTRQVIFFTQSGLVSVQSRDGTILWRHPFKYSVSTAASPVVAGDLVYCAAGYDVGSAALRISRSGSQWSATELWRSKGNQPVASHWSTPVHHNGHLYGMFSFKEYGSGPLKCVELATGKVLWSQPGFGAGNVLLAGHHLLALSDEGELVLVEATPSAYKELGRAPVVQGKCWSTPALAQGRVYVRSTVEGTCLDLSSLIAAR